jgi:uncharacterized protein YjbI with pentapeptide repeats
MANPLHVKILEQGFEVWNEWRKQNDDVVPDLREIKLTAANLTELANGLNLTGVDLTGANLYAAQLIFAQLNNANLSGANLGWADLREANLENANLSNTDLRGATFGRFNRVWSWVAAGNTSIHSIIGTTRLEGANLSGAHLGNTVFGDIDLSSVVGLDTAKHFCASTISVETLYLSQLKIPEVFLRGVGLPEKLITYLPALLNDVLQFYSCFISYSNKDLEFAERVHADLQVRGVRCWLAKEDLKIGAEIRTSLDESIRVHDKLLIVLSETSIASQWVQQEVETALARERQRKRPVLFPIRIDDAVMYINGGWPAFLRNTRNIGDFTRWKDFDHYERAFNRLLRDLKPDEQDLI